MPKRQTAGPIPCARMKSWSIGSMLRVSQLNMFNIDRRAASGELWGDRVISKILASRAQSRRRFTPPVLEPRKLEKAQVVFLDLRFLADQRTGLS